MSVEHNQDQNSNRESWWKDEPVAKESITSNPEQVKDSETESKRAEAINILDQFGQASIQKAQEAILASRQSRLEIEQQAKIGPVSRFFRTKVGLFAKAGIEMIPSPLLWGPGDIVTAISAVRGKDVLTNEPLDGVDRALYAIASAIPGVPSFILVEPVKLIRREIEEAVHAHSNQNTTGAVKGSITTGKMMRNLLKKIKDNF